MLGRDCHVPTGWVIHWQSGSWGRCSSRDGSQLQRGEIRRTRCSLHLWANCSRDLGRFNASARHLLDDLGRRISENTGEARETSFLYQRTSIFMQRFNAILLHDSLPATDCADWYAFSSQFLNPSEIIVCTEGYKVIIHHFVSPRFPHQQTYIKTHIHTCSATYSMSLGDRRHMNHCYSSSSNSRLCCKLLKMWQLCRQTVTCDETWQHRDELTSFYRWTCNRQILFHTSSMVHVASPTTARGTHRAVISMRHTQPMSTCNTHSRWERITMTNYSVTTHQWHVANKPTNN